MTLTEKGFLFRDAAFVSSHVAGTLCIFILRTPSHTCCSGDEVVLTIASQCAGCVIIELFVALDASLPWNLCLLTWAGTYCRDQWSRSSISAILGMCTRSKYRATHFAHQQVLCAELWSTARYNVTEQALSRLLPLPMPQFDRNVPSHTGILHAHRGQETAREEPRGGPQEATRLLINLGSLGLPATVAAEEGRHEPSLSGRSGLGGKGFISLVGAVDTVSDLILPLSDCEQRLNVNFFPIFAFSIR